MSVHSEALESEPTRPLLRVEYEALVEAGHLEDEPVELLEGRLVLMSPEGAPHAATISELSYVLTFALGNRARVRTGHPLAASEVSEPEPDIAVVVSGDYFREHPRSALLVVEVSFSSIRKDRLVKPAIYAAAGVPEYWVVDLTADTLVVMREPGPAGYARAQTYVRGEVLELVAFPDVRLAVDDVLPPR
jgi:Uma2 family endonuclease